jgi:hypothetical protein
MIFDDKLAASQTSCPPPLTSTHEGAGSADKIAPAPERRIA